MEVARVFTRLSRHSVGGDSGTLLLMGRELLSGVALVMNWCSLAGALEGALRFLGQPVTTPRVMGISGHAFRLALPLAGGEVAAPGAETAIDLERATALYRNLGRAFEVIAAWPDARDYAGRRAEAVKRVNKSIDRGAPAIVYDLHLPQFGLVTGYDDRAGTWSVRTMLSPQYGGELPLGRWPVPENPGPVVALIPAGRKRIEPRRAVLEALRFAVSYAERGDPGDPTGAVHGFAAYERWGEAFTRGEPISTAGNTALVMALQSARRDAAAFLRADAAAQLPGAAAALIEAAAAYDAEALAISRMMTMFPYPSGGDPANVASRVVAAGALREALVHERRAIAAISALLHT